VTSGATIPAWLARCLEDLRQCGAAEVAAVLPARSRAGPPKGLLFRLQERIDRRLFQRMPDAFQPMSVRAALPRCPVIHEPATDTEVDVVLDPLALLADDAAAPPPPRYGVWTVAFGRSGDPKTQTTPAYWEVVEGMPATETRLCIRRNGLDSTRVCYVSVAPTDRRSVSRSQNRVYWKMAAALVSQLRQLWQDPQAFTRGLQGATQFDSVQDPSAMPGNLAVARGCTRLVGRYVADKWRDARHREQWALAYRLGNGRLETLLPPTDRFWADPFPVRVGSEYYVFHEELLFSIGKGYLVVTVLDATGRVLERCTPVLEEDHHLSYPFVFQWGGDFFMIPETAAREQVRLYRCVRFPDRWKLERVLLSNLRAFDATAAYRFGRWWLFAAVAPYGAGGGYMDALHLFHADSPLGPWTPHRTNPVNSDVRSARPAGRLFERDGYLHRPAQDCSKHYGYAVSVNRIVRLDPESYDEVEVDKLLPTCLPHVTGVHTLNTAGELTVIDCLMRRRL
jgi:hypothetical protein